MPAALAPGLSPWTFNAHPEVWAEVLSLAIAYGAALRLLGPRYVEPGEAAATRGQVTCFGLGLLAILVSEGWPLSDIANHYLYSAHMVQHLLFTLAAPPLFLLGTPHWLARALVRRPGVWPLMRRVTKPLVAAILFNGVLVTSHWPLLLDLTLHSQPIHMAMHIVLFGAALIMWWPVLSPLPELPRISYPAQMLYLFLQTVIPTIPASFLTFASSPLYHFYTTVPRAFGISATDDTRISGLIMKLGMGMVLFTVIAVLFFRWSSKEERPERPDVLEWQEVERELNRSEPKNP